METVLLAIQPEEGVAAVLHDPAFQATRFAEIPKAKVARLYRRWEGLEAIWEQEG